MQELMARLQMSGPSRGVIRRNQRRVHAAAHAAWNRAATVRESGACCSFHFDVLMDWWDAMARTATLVDLTSTRVS